MPSSVHSWTIEQLSTTLAPVLAASRSAIDSLRPPALRPSPAITAVLDSLSLECPDEAARKALSPALFLSCGILYEQLFGSISGAILGRKLGGLRVTVHVPTLPVAAGLGSSAAFAVSTAGALLDTLAQCQGSASGLCAPSSEAGASPSCGWVGSDPSWLSCVNEWAYSCEMLFHGVPSGLDNTVAT